MNFLAHIYLSGENELVKVGNFIADRIKGSDYLNYEPDLQKGILLHRAIDWFTDSNEIYRKSKHRLHQRFGHYSGVIMDMIYDYFLAKNWDKFSNASLHDYAEHFYGLLQTHFEKIPPKAQEIATAICRYKWLEMYASQEGLAEILRQMSRRFRMQTDMSEAITELNEFYSEFETEFFAFMIEIEAMCKQQL